MFPLDYGLALMLLVQPSEPSEPPWALEHLHAIWPTMQSIAVQWEIMDPREARYMLNRPGEFAADLKILRRRFADLRDAPPLHDAMGFPDRTLINDLLAFNRAYHMHVDNLQTLELAYWWELRETLQENQRLYEVWDTVRDARCPYYHVTVRREALKKLRCMLGYQAYSSGRLPPHVPIWRFRRID